MKNSSRQAMITYVVGLTFYVASLFLPTGFIPGMPYGRDGNPCGGWFYLLWGMCNVDKYQIAWYANWVALVAAISIFRGRPRLGTILAGLALLIAQDGWRCYYVGVPTNAGGGQLAFLTASSYGYYCWLAAFACLLAAGIVKLKGTPGRSTFAREQA